MQQCATVIDHAFHAYRGLGRRRLDPVRDVLHGVHPGLARDVNQYLLTGVQAQVFLHPPHCVKRRVNHTVLG
jgi:hypothetical protein